MQVRETRGRSFERAAVACRHRRDAKPERLEHLVHEVLGAAVERLGMQQGRALGQKREADGGDRRHARIEDRGRPGAALQRHELVLEDLGVRMGESRVDEVDVLLVLRLELAERDGEGPLGRLGTGEHEGRRAVDGRTRRSHREARIEPPR